MIKYIQVFGLQCSGTNILRRLCDANFNIDIGEKHGSKHGVHLKSIVDRDYSDTLFLYIHKNIWAWACSMKDTTHGIMRTDLPLGRAIREPWGVPGFSFPNMLAMRNHVLKMFRTIESVVPNWINIDHDMMVFNPREVLQVLAVKFNIPLHDIQIHTEIDVAFIESEYNMEFEDREWLRLWDD